MKFPAEIDNLKTLKKGMKVVIAIENKDVKEVMRNIHNFIDKPLKVTLDIDADEQLERMSLITGEQRKKIYALLKDIDSQTGQGVESVKMTLKKGLVMDSNYQTAELFSLSDCSKETAGEFIEFLVVFAFRHGVELKEYPRNIFNDIERYIKVCWKEKICVICGKPADKAHYDAIGTVSYTHLTLPTNREV